MKTSPDFLLALAERLGWALLHSLWQGALVAVVLALVLQMLRNRSAASRHAACLLALIALAACVVGTAWRIPVKPSSVTAQTLATNTALRSEPEITRAEPAATADTAPGLAPSMDRAASAPSAPVLTFPHPWREHLAPWVPRISVAWMLGVFLLSLRHLLGWRRLRAWQRRGHLARPELQRSFARLLQKFGRRAGVRLLESTEAAGPMLVGIFKPAVLLPLRVVSGLGAAEIEAILAHELAHLVRRDAWSHLAQIAIETLLYYHPAVWWIGRCARGERENAADDLALAVCTDRRVYAGALAHLAELRFGTSSALAATGGSLLARIRRIVHPVPAEATASGWNLGVPLLLAALALIAIFHGRADDVQKPAKTGARDDEALVGAKPAIEPMRAFTLSLVPQSVDFDGSVNYGGPITTGSLAKTNEPPIVTTRNVTTSVSLFDGHPVLIGGLVREGVSPAPGSTTGEQPAAQAPEAPARKDDDAKTWVADAFQLDDAAKREVAIERIRAAMTSGNVDESRTGITAFLQLGPIEFDKPSFRPAVRALLASEDNPTRAAAASAFTMTGADAEDLPRILSLADDPAAEVRENLTGVIVQLTNRDLTGKAASDAILKLMANLPRDSRSVAHAMWGVKLSPGDRGEGAGVRPWH